MKSYYDADSTISYYIGMYVLKVQESSCRYILRRELDQYDF